MSTQAALEAKKVEVAQLSKSGDVPALEQALSELIDLVHQDWDEIKKVKHECTLLAFFKRNVKSPKQKIRSTVIKDALNHASRIKQLELVIQRQEKRLQEFPDSVVAPTWIKQARVEIEYHARELAFCKACLGLSY